MVLDKGNVYKNKESGNIIIVVGYSLDSISLSIRGLTQPIKEIVFEHYISDNYIKETLERVYKEELYYYYIDLKTNLVELFENGISEINLNVYEYEKKISEKEVDIFVLKQHLVNPTISYINKFITREELTKGISTELSKFYKENENYIYSLLDGERTKFNKLMENKRKELDKASLENQGKLVVRTLKDLLRCKYFITVSKRYIYLYGRNTNNFVYIDRALRSNKEACFKLYLKTQSRNDFSYLLDGKEVNTKDIKGTEIIELEQKKLLGY